MSEASPALTDADQDAGLVAELREDAEIATRCASWVSGNDDEPGPRVDEQLSWRAAKAIATLRARAAAAEAERDKLRSDLAAAVILVGEHARARGEAEGRLRVAALPGIVEGWRDRATAAEDKLKDREAEIERLKIALKPFAKAGELFGPPREEGFDEGIYLPAAGPEYAIGGSDLRRARAALASTDHPASSEEATDA